MCCAVHNQTDGHTDRQTDRQTAIQAVTVPAGSGGGGNKGNKEDILVLFIKERKLYNSPVDCVERGNVVAATAAAAAAAAVAAS